MSSVFSFFLPLFILEFQRQSASGVYLPMCMATDCSSRGASRRTRPCAGSSAARVTPALCLSTSLLRTEGRSTLTQLPVSPRAPGELARTGSPRRRRSEGCSTLNAAAERPRSRPHSALRQPERPPGEADPDFSATFAPRGSSLIRSQMQQLVSTKSEAIIIPTSARS